MTAPTGNPRGRTIGYQHAQKTRDRIQVSQLVNRLEKNASGKLEPLPEIEDWLNRWEEQLPEDCLKQLHKALNLRARTGMTPTQVKSAEILLNKCLANLSAVEQTTMPQDKGDHLSDTELEAIAQTPLKVVQGKGSS